MNCSRAKSVAFGGYFLGCNAWTWGDLAPSCTPAHQEGAWHGLCGSHAPQVHVAHKIHP